MQAFAGMYVSLNEVCVKPFRADTRKVTYMSKVHPHAAWVAPLPMVCTAWGEMSARANHHCLVYV